jgi:putative tricarboxylic transport membrane protein
MARANFVAGCVIVLIGAMAIWGALRLPIGRLGSPEPGLVPLVEGILLGLTGLVLVFQASARSATKRIEWPTAEARRMILHLSGVMFAYLLLMPLVGFVLSTFLFLTLAIKAWRRYSTPAAVLYAAAITLVIYLTFNVALNMPLPQGPYGLP